VGNHAGHDGSDEEMRFYAAGNMYLSSIQQGIQAFHCLGEMVSNRGAEIGMVDEWLHNHKTLVCLNGGNNKSLTEFYDMIVDNPLYPVAKFHEDDQSMGGMLTCVGIIVPERIYAANLEDPAFTDLFDWEIELATKLRRMPLAR
jgi:hypothetical protein